MTDTFQWQKCNSLGASCVDIAGATGSAYTLVTGDVGSKIKLTGTRDGVAVTPAITSVIQAAGSDSVLWNGDFETGNFSQYDDVTQGNHNAVVSGSQSSVGGPTAARKGTYYYHSEVHSGDVIAGGERCEIIKGNIGESGAPVNGDDLWYGWSLWIPSNFPSDGLTGQFHGTYDYAQANIQFFIDHGQVGAFGASGTNPRWVIGINGGPAVPNGQYVNSPSSKAFDLGLLSNWKGAGWLDIIFHVIWKDTTTGTVELWIAKNGGAYTKFVSQIGNIANLYQGYTAYLKQGINRTQNSGLPIGYLWFDETKKGTSFSSVDPQA